MKAFRNFAIACLIVVGGYYALLRPTLDEAQPTRAAALQMDGAPMPTATLQPLHTPTASPIPSPTIGYQATIDVVQSLLDNELRKNLEFTVSSAGMTEQADIWTATLAYHTLVADQATSTAVLTAVPKTEAAQGTQNAITIVEQGIVVARITSTHEAPELIRKAAAAENEATFGWWWSLGSVVALFGIGVGFAGLAVFALRRKPAPIETGAGQGAGTELPEVRVTIQRGTEYPRVDHTLFPGSKTELMIMADEVRRNPSMAVNRWDKVKGAHGGMLFSRARLAQVFFFLTHNTLAIETAKSEIVLLDDGLDFFENVLNLGDAPLPYTTMPESSPAGGEINHDHENHGHDSGGGVVFAPQGGV